MKPAARNFPLIFPAIVWLVAALGGVVAMTSAAPAPTTAPAAVSAAAPAAAPAAQDLVRALLAHGTNDRFWSADVVPLIQGKTTGSKTHVRVRGAGETQWQPVGEFEAAATSLSNRGGELLVVLDNGDWKLVSGGGVRSGNPLPGGAQVLALAGDGDDIWAIAAAPKGKTLSSLPPASTTTTARTSTVAPEISATRTATPPAATQSSPTSTASAAGGGGGATVSPTAAPHEVGLFLLSRGGWVEKDVLPRGIDRGDLRLVSLAVLDRRLMLALADSDGAVRVFSRAGAGGGGGGGAGGWDGGADVAVAAPPNSRIKLLELAGRPGLWVTDGSGPGALYALRERWEGPTRLEASPKLANAFDRTALAAALGQIRLLASDGKGRLAEQIYGVDGKLAGQATEAVTAPSAIDSRIAQVIQLVVVAVLFVWMMGALRQRPALQEAVKRVDELNLAPLGRRLLGGLIDALPIVVAFYIAERATPDAGAAARLTYQSPQIAWLAAGIGLYLLHTTLCELILGRTVGKIVAGTRVVNLEGNRPKATAMLTRNLLRIVDVVLLFAPVIFIFFSPLRQRIGDMAGGTLVVLASPEDDREDEPDDDARRGD